MKQKLLFLTFLLLLFIGVKAQTTYTAATLKKTFAASVNRDSLIEDYLLKNQVYNINISPEGIYYKVDKTGNGKYPLPGSMVTVHYTGKLLNGTKFDSSKDRNKPFTFQLGQNRVIQGWEKGIPLFQIGGTGTLYIPAKLAYGNQQKGAYITPNSPLIFDIEVISSQTPAEYEAAMIAQQKKLQEEAEAKQKAQLAIDRTLIEQYAKEKGLVIQTTPSGLSYIIEKQGDGAKVEAGKTAVTHYRGYTLNGQVFDASYDRNQPFPVPVGQGRVIKGWDEGLPLFNVGGKGKLLIPSGLAYGQQSMGPSIPANAVLIFDIEIIEVK
ncbi:MAG: FKBP-type peptidyl-prolyl cis-trans isomerase [Chitinophagales bacterium]|nr:FKBP-type peptidyl-prolyl cis-trans isomerase [Chitinophagales bacterium]